jgi:hypothetical protein
MSSARVALWAERVVFGVKVEVKDPGKEMDMEVHGTNTKHDRPVWEYLRECLRCFWKERTPSVSECVYRAFKQLRLRHLGMLCGLYRIGSYK